jgi:hypothetical protein
MNFSKFITTDFWFNSTTASDPRTIKILLLFFGFMSLIGTLTFLNKFILAKARSKIAYLLVTVGLLGLLLTALRYESIYILGSRILLLILFLVWLVWLVSILIYFIKDYPAELKKIENYRKFQSYLPKPKKK